MYMLFLNLITIKLCILHKYHLPSWCGSVGICHSTCLEMPRIAKFRTFFYKKILGEDPRWPQTPLSIQLFLSFFFCGPSPQFSAPSYATDNILQIWMIPHIITLFEFISVPYKLTGGKLGFASIYLRIHVKLLDFQGAGGGGLPLSLLARGRFRKLPICFMFSSYRSIYDNKKGW